MLSGVVRTSALRSPDLANVVLAASVAGMATTTATDPDLFWHLATGRLIRATHHVPRTDPFSSTAHGRRWIAHEWLTEVVMSLLHSLGGWTLLVAVWSVVITAAWLVVRTAARRDGASPLAASLVTGLAALASVHTWGQRPQMLSLLLTAVFVLLIRSARAGSNRLLWWCAALLPLWANLHGGYIFGTALLGLAAGGATVDALLARRRGLPPPSTSFVRTAWAATVVGALGTLCTPNGWDGFVYPFTYLGDNASTRYVAEWFAPDFTRPQYWPFAVLLVVVTVAIWRARRTITLTDAGTALAFAFLGLQSVRNITLFGVVTTPWVAAALTGARPGARLGTRRPRTGDDLSAAAAHRARIAIGTLVVLGWSAVAGPNLRPSASTADQRRMYPVDAAVWMADRPLRSGCIFNEYDFGGWLIWKLPETQQPVYVDGRPDMYGDAFMDHYVSIWRLRPGWKARLAHDGVQAVVASPGSAIVRALRRDRGWRTVYEDRTAVILDRVA